MKVRRSPGGKKAGNGVLRRKSTFGMLFALVALSTALIYSLYHSSADQTTSQTLQAEAAIVDQLSLTFSNQTFIETATNTLKRAGYNVDYYPGEQVTVEFYRNMPTHGYKILILRVHSLADIFQGKQMVGCFTSELYSKTRYVYEQLTDQVGSLGYYPGDPTRHFGITQEFVKSSMNGKFQNTVIIAMGCEGLNNTKMAEALIRKGAKAYIGWSQGVSASHTDQATIQLLRHMTISNETIGQAVNKTVNEVGPDPSYNTLLIYYPLEAGEEKMDDIGGKN